jgi:transposase
MAMAGMREPREIGDEEHEQVLGRVAAVDVAKASGMVCIRVPHDARPGRRRSRVWPVDAATSAIPGQAGHLATEGVEKVTWRPPAITCEVRVHEFEWKALLEAG